MTQKVSDYVKNMQNNYFKFVFFFFLRTKVETPLFYPRYTMRG